MATGVRRRGRPYGARYLRLDAYVLWLVEMIRADPRLSARPPSKHAAIRVILQRDGTRIGASQQADIKRILGRKYPVSWHPVPCTLSELLELVKPGLSATYEALVGHFRDKSFGAKARI